MNTITNKEVLLVAFGGGSIIDAVKLMANTLDLTYITFPRRYLMMQFFPYCPSIERW